jgi:ribosomal protein L35
VRVKTHRSAARAFATRSAGALKRRSNEAVAGHQASD